MVLMVKKTNKSNKTSVNKKMYFEPDRVFFMTVVVSVLALVLIGTLIAF